VSVAPLRPSTAPLRLPLPARRREPARADRVRDDRAWIAIVAGCLALGALSLVGPSQPTYDPMSWIIWGREIAHGTLDTVQGPSWKPLPMLFTVPFSGFGDAAPQLWLVVARAGGLLGIAMGARLAWRLAGWPAGLIAGVAILASEGYAYGAWRGNSEGLLTALVLWAVARHLDGRHTWAFVLGFGAALLRPEVWPFWGLYGLWLGWTQPERRVLVAALFAAIPLAWFVPEYLGSGDFLRAASRARQPNLDSAAYAAFPAFEVLRRSFAVLPLVIGAGALAALGTALRRRSGEHDHIVLVLGGTAAALLLAVALMTQGGFSGNLRYVVLPVAFVCVLAGAGWVEAVRYVRRRGGLLAAVSLALIGLAGAGYAARAAEPEWSRSVAATVREANGIDELPNLIALAGGRDAINRCGPIYSGRFEVPAVAWQLHRHLEDVDIFPLTPGVALAMRGSALAHDPRFPTYAGTTRWVAGRACGRP
jgi:hypothetical protein